MTNIENNFDKLTNFVNEEVFYQNPLLFLNIYEVTAETPHFNVLEDCHWHYHKEVEFIAVLEGHLGIQSKSNYILLSPGDLVVLGSSQLHRSHKPFAGPLKYVVLQVDLIRHFDQSIIPYLNCFSELTEPLDGLNYIFNSNSSTKCEAYNLIMEIFNESQTMEKGYEIAISVFVRRLLLLLLRSDTRNILHYTEKSGLNRLKPVLDYVDTHLKGKITVEDACNLVNLSYHYFIKYFKKIIGVSFVDFVNYKRIKESERLLLTSELSITEIGYEIGISNMAQFYKLFKRYNLCSPKQFKHHMLSKSNLLEDMQIT